MATFNIYPWLFPCLAGIFGLIVGSFLNVVIHRLPIMMERQWKQDLAEAFPEHVTKSPDLERFNLNVPRSHCPHCQTQLRIQDNIPILSWLILKGKCYHCHGHISRRYPLIELLTTLLATNIAYQFGISPFSISLLFFTFSLIAASFIDLDTLLLPDLITLPLMWAGILIALLGWSPISLEDAVIGAMLGYASLWSLYWLFRLATGKEGMGYGDFKLLAALGAWLGWQSLPLLIMLSSITALGISIGLILYKRQRVDKQFPFGPYLALAGFITLCWGENIMDWYFTSILGF